MILNSKYNLPVLVVLIFAGLIGNHFKYPVFLNIDFIFGSIFSMLALQFFGLGRGIFAAAIVACYTWVHWNHPYAIIIMTAEAAVVGLLMKRRSMGMVLADTVYWLFVGIPMVYLFYYFVMDSSVSSTLIVMTKQTINGISNALLARLLFSAYLNRSQTGQISLVEATSNAFAFFVLTPVIIVLAVSSRSDFSETDLLIRNNVSHSSKSIARNLDKWLESRSLVISNLAEMALERTPSQMQVHLEQALASDISFYRIGLQNVDAVVTAHAPMMDELGKPNIGKDFSNRPFIKDLKNRCKPMLTEVVMEQFTHPRPLAVMLVPIMVDGVFSSYIAGVLNLQEVSNYLSSNTDIDGMNYSLLDKNGNIIATNKQGQKLLKPIKRENGKFIKLEDGIVQWIPGMESNVSIMEQWKKTTYITELSIGKLAEWKLVLEQPVAPFQKILYERYSKRLILLFILLLSALAIAELLGRSMAAKTRQLGRLTRDMPAQIASDVSVEWPQSSITETALLIENFKEMAEALYSAFSANQLINKRLEQQVDERTRELLKAKEDAEAANFAKSRFLSVVAHQFHTPLGLLTVSADILERYWSRLDQEGRESQYKQIRSAASQLAKLVKSVTAFNHHYPDNSDVIEDSIDIGHLCHIIADQVKTVWCNGQQFDVSISPECGSIRISETLFRRVLENILTNAFRFTSEGGKVKLNVSRNNNCLLLEVSDTGIGIPEEDHHKIFEAFFRSDNAETINGLGLGLSIVNEAVKYVNGSISMTSKVGIGTTFRVELPVLEASGKDPA